MANNINREGFKRFLELGAPSFEGNIILDSGELSEYYYRFMRIPLAYGEHKVDVLYGQRFYGTLENKPVTFNQEIRFLCLVVDNAKTVNETQDFKTIFCRSSFTSDSVIEEMAQKLFDMFRENVTEEDKKKILKGGYYDQTARQNAFCRIIKGYKNYRSPIDSKHPVFVDDGFGKPVPASDVIQNRDGEFSSRCSTSKELFDFNVKVAQNR